jgi:transposase
MAKVFRPYDPEQQFLLPPSLDDWLPQEHPARFVNELLDRLDLTAITAPYEKEERGYPPYHPVMMTKIILYGYVAGVYSSRRIAKALETDVAFRWLAAQNRPDHRTVCLFRKTHRLALCGLFQQVLDACVKMKLVKLGTVAIDGSRIKASASKHKAMSAKRMKEKRDELTRQVEEWLNRSDREDDDDDKRFGAGRRGDEMPEHLASKQKRLEKIEEALRELEREADQEARESGKDPAEARVPDKAQKNFTDPESKILKASDGFIQGYNAQIAVDAEHQIIVARDVVPHGNDQLNLAPMVDRIVEGLGQPPAHTIADNGYFSEAGIWLATARGTEPLIAAGRTKHGEQPVPVRGRMPENLTAKQRMKRKLSTKRGHALYALRKTIVEPVFGQMKAARGFRQFLMRGLKAVRAEWDLVCTAHNILKMWRAGVKLATG